MIQSTEYSDGWWCTPANHDADWFLHVVRCFGCTIPNSYLGIGRCRKSHWHPLEPPSASRCNLYTAPWAWMDGDWASASSVEWSISFPWALPPLSIPPVWCEKRWKKEATHFTEVLLEKMVLSHAPSTTASNAGSDVALSDLTYANGHTDHTRWGESSAFPSIWRPRQENTHPILPDDAISSVVNTSKNDVLPPPQERKIDALAPRSETRRLGYFSVAALIINRMIGGYLRNRIVRGWSLYTQVLGFSQRPAQYSGGLAEARERLLFSGFLGLLPPWLGYRSQFHQLWR